MRIMDRLLDSLDNWHVRIVWFLHCRKCQHRICEQEPVTEADIENWWKVMANYEPMQPPLDQGTLIAKVEFPPGIEYFQEGETITLGWELTVDGVKHDGAEFEVYPSDGTDMTAYLLPVIVGPREYSCRRCMAKLLEAPHKPNQFYCPERACENFEKFIVIEPKQRK